MENLNNYMKVGNSIMFLKAGEYVRILTCENNLPVISDEDVNNIVFVSQWKYITVEFANGLVNTLEEISDKYISGDMDISYDCVCQIVKGDK